MGSVKTQDGVASRNAPIGRASMVAYGSGSLIIGMLNSVPTVLLLFFCTEILGIAPAIAAAIILAPKIWIVFWDPLVGTWSDRSHSRWGRRAPFILAGGAISIVAFIGLFSPPDLRHAALIAAIAVAFFGLMTGYSLFKVPYVAIPTEITDDDDVRSRLIRSRTVFHMIGILLGTAAAPFIVQAGGGGRPGYSLMAVSIGLVSIIGLVGPLAMLSHHAAQSKTAQSKTARNRSTDGILSQMGRALQEPRFRSLALAQVLQVTAIGLVSASLPYLVTRGMHRPQSDIGTTMLFYLLPSIVAVSFWGFVGRKIGDGAAQGFSALSYGLGSAALGLCVLYGGSWPVFLATLPLLGIGFGGMQGQSFTIAARIIHRAAGGTAQATYTGMWTATERFGLALGPSLTGIALAIWGGTLATWSATAAPLLFLMSLPFLARATRSSTT